MKQIILNPTVIVTIDDNDITVDMDFCSSIVEAMDDDGEFREVTEEESKFIDERVLPFIQTEINL
jgi:hypothetical protein